MFEKDAIIVYGNTGVCRVEEIGCPRSVRGAAGDKLYYTLAPLYSSEVIYAPVDTTVFMRPVLSREEALALIDRIPMIRAQEHVERDQRLLTEQYRGLFESHRCEDLLQLIKTIYQKNRTAVGLGRKPGQVDIRYRKRAEDLLYGELSVALGIGLDEVEPFISARMAELEAAE